MKNILALKSVSRTEVADLLSRRNCSCRLNDDGAYVLTVTKSYRIPAGSTLSKTAELKAEALEEAIWTAAFKLAKPDTLRDAPNMNAALQTAAKDTAALQTALNGTFHQAAAASAAVEAVKQARTLHQVRMLIDLACLVLPKKITDECLGDSFEALGEMAETTAGWRLQLDALISIGWASLFTLREIAKPGALLAAIWKLLFG